MLEIKWATSLADHDSEIFPYLISQSLVSLLICVRLPRPAMKSRHNATLYSALLLVAANLLIPVSILTFATGFFPYKPFIPGLAQYSEASGYGSPPPAPFDRLVFLVVDALRR